MTRFLLLLIAMGWACSINAGPFSLLPGHGEHPDKNPLRAGSAQPQNAPPSLSPGEAAQRAQQLNGGGQVLAAKQVSGGWQVKLIKNGEVRSLFVPE